LFGPGAKRESEGGIALGIVVCLELFAVGLSLVGTSLNVVTPSLVVLYFLPFVWLLVESKTTRSMTQGMAPANI